MKKVKLKFVELVMISVSDLAPALAILWAIIFLITEICYCACAN